MFWGSLSGSSSGANQSVLFGEIDGQWCEKSRTMGRGVTSVSESCVRRGLGREKGRGGRRKKEICLSCIPEAPYFS